MSHPRVTLNSVGTSGVASTTQYFHYAHLRPPDATCSGSQLSGDGVGKPVGDDSSSRWMYDFGAGWNVEEKVVES